jgi:hypothetical protein
LSYGSSDRKHFSGVQEFRSSGVQEFRSSGVIGEERKEQKIKTAFCKLLPTHSATPELLQLLNSFPKLLPDLPEC